MNESTPQDRNAAALAAAIGQRVRQERQDRGWTLDGLAEAAGISRRMLINVEQGSANPSVGTLLKLSDALGVGLPALVSLPEPAQVKVTRHGEGAVLWSGDAGGHGVLLVGTEPPDILELWEWTLQPGEHHDSEAHSEGTWELLQVREGVITLTINDEDIRLEAGDAVSFAGNTAHRYLNDETSSARFTLCVFEPGVGKGG